MSGDAERVAIAATDDDDATGGTRREALGVLAQRDTLGVRMQHRHDGHSRVDARERVVMAHLAGEIKLGASPNRILVEVAACASSHGDLADVALVGPGDEDVLDAEP